MVLPCFTFEPGLGFWSTMLNGGLLISYTESIISHSRLLSLNTACTWSKLIPRKSRTVMLSPQRVYFFKPDCTISNSTITIAMAIRKLYNNALVKYFFKLLFRFVRKYKNCLYRFLRYPLPSADIRRHLPSPKEMGEPNSLHRRYFPTLQALFYAHIK